MDSGEIEVVLSLVPEKKTPVPSIDGVIEARFLETTCRASGVEHMPVFPEPMQTCSKEPSRRSSVDLVSAATNRGRPRERPQALLEPPMILSTPGLSCHPAASCLGLLRSRKPLSTFGKP